jgi:hypothetical protein
VLLGASCGTHVQGVEAADNILFGAKELTLSHPNIVNVRKNTELLFSRRGFVSQ